MNPEKPLPNVGALPLPLPLPNNEVPAVDVAVEVAGNVDVNPKPVLPNTLPLAVDAGAVEVGAPNPLNVVPGDAPPNPPPKGLALGVDVAVLKLLPKGDVAAVPLLPKIPVLEAEVVAVVGAPKLLPNGLEGEVVVVLPNPLPKIEEAEVVVAAVVPPKRLGAEVVALPNRPEGGADVVVGLPKIPVAGADVVVAGAAKPLPNGLGTADAAEPNGLILGTDVVAAVVVVEAPPNGAGADVVVEAPPNDAGAVVVEVAAPLPNTTVADVVGVKLNAAPPRAGFEPNELKPVDIMGLVVGETC